jgi:hypothetical protein
MDERKRVVVAVPFFDSKENRRHYRATYPTLNILKDVLDPRHIIFPVDNGSTDDRTWQWLNDTRPFEHFTRIDEPQSIAYGVNAAWHPFHDDLMAGSILALKYDSDIWINPSIHDAIEMLAKLDEIDPSVGLAGIAYNTHDYSDKNPADVRKKYFYYRFIYGAVSLRTSAGFRAIGYCKNPHGRWGYQDLWDSFRTSKAGLKKAVLRGYAFRQITGTGSLLAHEKDEIKDAGHKALIQLQREVNKGKRPIFQEAFE